MTEIEYLKHQLTMEYESGYIAYRNLKDAKTPEAINICSIRTNEANMRVDDLLRRLAKVKESIKQ